MKPFSIFENPFYFNDRSSSDLQICDNFLNVIYYHSNKINVRKRTEIQLKNYCEIEKAERKLFYNDFLK